MKKSSIKELKWEKRYTYLRNIPFSERDLSSKGAKFQIVKFRPNTSIKPHYHKKATEVFYIKSGDGIVKINGKKFRCKPDDFFLCERRDTHSFINDTKQDFIILIFKTNEEERDIYWE